MFVPDSTNALTEKPNAVPVPFISEAAVIHDGRYLPPPQDGDGKVWVRASVVIDADAPGLYRMWRDIESAPQWQEQIASVTRTGEKTSHWVMQDGDKTIEWDSEILADEPGRRIAWRSVAGDSHNAGEVIFTRAPGGRGTMVIVLQEFGLGKLTNAWESVTGRGPKQAVVENLRHLKQLAETGEIPRITGQPHGPRGTVGNIKKSLYGETEVPPPGENRRAND
jgi:uncharacterized membrane protein